MRHTHRSVDLLATALALLAYACTSDGGAGSDPGTGPSPQPAQETGALEISVTTIGPALDPDGYAVLLDGQAGQAIPTQGQLVLGHVRTGWHAVALAGIALTCEPLDNARNVQVVAGDTARVQLAINCPGSAALRVITHTAGAPVDPDGYLVHVPVAPELAIGIEDTVELADLPIGNQPVRLSGLAANCVVATPERVLYLAGGQTITVTYDVSCTSPDVGAVLVIVSTLSVNAPANMTFSVVLDELHSLPVASTGSATFRDVTPGDHSVRLRMPFFCGVGLFGASGTNPVRVTVAPGGSQIARFNVLCIG